MLCSYEPSFHLLLTTFVSWWGQEEASVDQRREAALCTLRDSEDVDTFLGARPRTVVFDDSGNPLSCSCQTLTFMGLICRHIVAVLVYNQVKLFPMNTSDARWISKKNDRVASQSALRQMLMQKHKHDVQEYFSKSEPTVSYATNRNLAMLLCQLANTNNQHQALNDGLQTLLKTLGGTDFTPSAEGRSAAEGVEKGVPAADDKTDHGGARPPVVQNPIIPPKKAGRPKSNKRKPSFIEKDTNKGKKQTKTPVNPAVHPVFMSSSAGTPQLTKNTRKIHECPVCGERVKGKDAAKSAGVWRHIECVQGTNA